MIQRKRRPWLQHEVNSLVKGIELYGVGNWHLMLSDPKLHFDDRTTVDLKDKYRNLVKKTEITSNSFQVKPIVRKSESSDPVASPMKKSPSKEAAVVTKVETKEEELKVQDIFMDDNSPDIKLVLSMNNQDEREVKEIDLPEHLEYLLEDYKNELKHKYSLVKMALYTRAQRKRELMNGDDSLPLLTTTDSNDMTDKIVASIESYRERDPCPSSPKKVKSSKGDQCVIN